MGINIAFITSLDVNVGDEFIREGICSFLDELYKDWNPYYVNKVGLETIYNKVKDEKAEIGDKLVNADAIIQAGAPVYWNIGTSTSYNVEWADELWFKRIFRLGPDKPVLNIAAGACQPFPDTSKSFLLDPVCVDFARNIDRACRWTSVRDPLASQILYALDIRHDVLPCSAFHAARRMPGIVSDKSLVGINLMSLGGHFKFRDDIDQNTWRSTIDAILPVFRKKHKIIFIAHDREEEKFMLNLALPGEKVFISGDYREYMKVYASCSIVVANRVHGAVCAAGFGNPSIIIGNDSRLQIADYIGIPSHYVGFVSKEQIIADFDKAVENNQIERERLINLREESAERYREAISTALGFEVDKLQIPHRKSIIDVKPNMIPLSLASVKELKSISFTDFMSTMNCFAERLGLRTFTNWSKVWEYPWIWRKALSGRDWSKTTVLDLGSEISPMPWFLASMGAKVTLIECDPQWIDKWERLKKSRGLDVDWRIVKDENLPFEEKSFDLVTSFSVIEHQGDKRKAVDEVIRVLKPGGVFALSFDICEPEMGMTFPEWNGRALTMKEFEDVVWCNSGFVNNPKPVWNTEEIKEFIAWHLQSAAHHNYTVGAAVLWKKIFDEKSAKRILLPRFDTHGDIILLQGLIQKVLANFPNAEVTLLVREGYDQLAPLFPARLRWQTQPCNPWARYGDNDLDGIRKVLDGIAQDQWDLVLFTTYNRTFLEDLLAASLDGGAKIAFSKQEDFSRWQERMFKKLGLKHPQYDYIVPAEELSHETEKYQIYCRTLFEKSCELSAPQLTVPDNIATQVRTVMAELGLEPGKFVACMPAGTQNVKIKKWPEERYAEVLVWMYREHGLTPLLFGHEDEREILEKVAGFVRTKNVEPRIWIGKAYEFAVLGGILEKARLYLGNDTGPMHLAAALGVPTLGMFGGGTWPRFTPAGDHSIAIAAIIPCYYCMWDCIFDNAPCLSFVNVEHVKKAINDLLGNSITDKVINVASSLCPTALEFAGKAAEKTRILRNEAERRQDLIETLSELLAENNELHERLIEAMKRSLSWKITAPLRKIMDKVRKL